MSAPSTATGTVTGAGRQWWRDAVVYQVYVRSFADADGDGVGDLAGITARLPHLSDLGVDALWITPFYISPQHDHGYDVADYRDVDPLFGTLADADALLSTAHGLGLKVIVDLVPNHTSSAHAWFQDALDAAPGSPERARYLFRDGREPDGDEPPNNWQSVFGGPAWTRVPDGPDGPDRPEGTGQWYLHLFDSSQPDLDWRNPEVGDMFVEVLRFWLDRGVDGFRVDVAHGLLKESTLRDQVVTPEEAASNRDLAMVDQVIADEPMWDQPEVHEVYRRWRRVLEEYDGDGGGSARMGVAEAWARTPDAVAAYVRPDELHQAFNFDWVLAPWSAETYADVVERTLGATGAVGASATWVLSNHDVHRHPTRYGGGAVGLARARAATLLTLALPGSAYVYQGEELGLEDVDVAPEDRQDPSWFRTGKPGRDGARVPIPWSGQAPPYGFGPGSTQPWIPQPAEWAGLTVAAQSGTEGSTLEFYRAAIAARRLIPCDDAPVTTRVEGDVLIVTRGDLVVAINCGSGEVAMPEGELVIASGPTSATLPADTTAWLRRN